MPINRIRNSIRERIGLAEKEISKPDYSEAVFSVMESRRSTRKYLDKNVPDELLERILDAAGYAPSAGNFQPYEFIVVKNPETKKHIAEACKQDWMAEAPVHIIVCTNMKIASMYEERGMKLYGIQDTAMAAGNILLVAEALGLRTCWVGAFGEAQVSILLHCPEYVRPAAIITVGYSDEKISEPQKHGIDNYAHREKFGERWKK